MPKIIWFKHKLWRIGYACEKKKKQINGWTCFDETTNIESPKRQKQKQITYLKWKECFLQKQKQAKDRNKTKLQFHTPSLLINLLVTCGCLCECGGYRREAIYRRGAWATARSLETRGRNKANFKSWRLQNSGCTFDAWIVQFILASQPSILQSTRALLASFSWKGQGVGLSYEKSHRDIMWKRKLI